MVRACPHLVPRPSGGLRLIHPKSRAVQLAAKLTDADEDRDEVKEVGYVRNVPGRCHRTRNQAARPRRCLQEAALSSPLGQREQGVCARGLEDGGETPCKIS